MRWANLETRQGWVVAHPMWAGLAWGAAMTLVIVAFEKFAQHQPVDSVWIVKRTFVFALVGLVWGYASRWAILRRREHAR